MEQLQLIASSGADGKVIEMAPQWQLPVNMKNSSQDIIISARWHLDSA